MSITLTSEIEEKVIQRVNSGAYESAAEVVMESLRLLEAQEKGMEVLRQEILRGVLDIEQGRFTSYKTDEELDGLSEKIIQRCKLKQSVEKE